MKIALDFGHCLSGFDSGAQGNGYREEKCTREIGKRVKERLERLGHKVIVVSPDFANSVSESLAIRVNRINAERPDMSISIHLNAGGGTGTEIFTKGARSFFEPVNILKEFEKLGYRNRGIKDGNVLALVGSVNNSKAMLVECCFIDSANDMKVYNPDKIATAIVKGIDNRELGSGSGEASKPEKVQETNPPVAGTINKYLNLNKNVERWRVYPTNKAPVVGNEVGFLSPSKYGGLTYKILANPQADVYTINTTYFGTVNIYAPRDAYSTITESGGNSTNNNTTNNNTNNSNKKYLNLLKHVPAWRVYPLSKAPVVGNEVGTLAPSRYAGLSYEILGNPQKDVYTINTSVFGKVNIFAPRDKDSSITNSPIY